MLSKSSLGQSPAEFAEVGLLVATICGKCWNSLKQNSLNCSKELKILIGVPVYSTLQSLLSGPDLSRLSLFWDVSLLYVWQKILKPLKRGTSAWLVPKDWRHGLYSSFPPSCCCELHFLDVEFRRSWRKAVLETTVTQSHRSFVYSLSWRQNCEIPRFFCEWNKSWD